jgi:cytochrome c oxidase subunit 4
MPHHIVARKTLVFAYVILLVLTLATVLIAYLDLGPASMAIGIVIATIQASLIAGFFMHALYESALVRVVAAGGVVWFLIMMTLVINDFITRGWLPFPGK